MRDFLKGTIGTLLRVILNILGTIFFIVGIALIILENSVTGIITIVIGVICFCMAMGIKYWLGQVIHHRNNRTWRS